MSNIFTYFNILNILLAVGIIVSGILFEHFFDSFKNCFFLGVVIANTVISIVQEILAKKTIDNLSVLSMVKSKVIRDGIEKIIDKEDSEFVEFISPNPYFATITKRREELELLNFKVFGKVISTKNSSAYEA